MNSKKWPSTVESGESSRFPLLEFPFAKGQICNPTSCNNVLSIWNGRGANCESSDFVGLGVRWAYLEGFYGVFHLTVEEPALSRGKSIQGKYI